MNGSSEKRSQSVAESASHLDNWRTTSRLSSAGFVWADLDLSGEKKIENLWNMTAGKGTQLLLLELVSRLLPLKPHGNDLYLDLLCHWLYGLHGTSRIGQHRFPPIYDEAGKKEIKARAPKAEKEAHDSTSGNSSPRLELITPRRNHSAQNRGTRASSDERRGTYTPEPFPKLYTTVSSKRKKEAGAAKS